MAENTRMKEMQAEICTNADDIRHLATMVEKLQKTMEAKTRAQEATMEEIKLSLQQLLQNSSHTHGSPSNSNSMGIVPPITMVSPIKDISIGFPHYDGSFSVLEWIFKADKFFNYHYTPDAERVNIASMHFEKDVVSWFQMLQKIEEVPTWSALTRALESQFGPSPFDCPMADLFKLQQNGSVSDYYLQFMSLANRSEGLTEEAILNCFISGLNVDIKRNVIAFSPPNILRVVALAKFYEEKYTPGQKPNVNYPTKYNHSPFISSSTTSTSRLMPKNTLPNTKTTVPPLLPNPLGPQLRNSNVKRISLEEMQLRREKGLYYFCDEKFSFNHKCPNKQLYVLQLGDEDSIHVENHAEKFPESQSPLTDDHHLSLNALKGGFGVGTIKFMAHVGTMPIKVLIDGGSSNNFLQPRVAKFLKLPIKKAPMFKVMVGNGNYMELEGLIQQLTLQAQGNVFTLLMFLLPISGADLILGASWLKTIGPHLADYESLQIKFLHEGRFTTLQGDSDILPTTAQLHHIRRMVHTNVIAEVYSMQVI
ncbi:uncharacterized protein LOC113859732 [Abrus precatorius]|uniref:Uncharacterized protein LOC113859732 n=1 Tax=Abrus precatorius TaxID=3816 RepID=A0A8B8KWI4_ABRPR|nr:uncharacterized protein LOC113859732 [Abrus precatorius]